MLERHGTALLDHDARVAAEGRDPLAELLRVRDRGGERDHAHRRREVDQDLLPDGAAVRVLEVVHLVHHDGVQPRERRRPLVQHVAEHLGGHHDHGRLRVDRVVARQQTDASRRRAWRRGRRTSGSRAPSAGSCRRPSRPGRARARSRTPRRPSCRSRSARPRGSTSPGATASIASRWNASSAKGNCRAKSSGVVTVRQVYGRPRPSPVGRRPSGGARDRAPSARRRAPRRRPPAPRGSTGGRRPRSGGAPRPPRRRRCRR